MDEKVIFLVEDDPDDEMLAIRALKKNKILNRVVVAHDGEEALKILFHTQPAIRPTVIPLDIKLPKIDGLQVLKQIRSPSPDQDFARGRPDLFKRGARPG